ncbi:hypothetical protein PoB_003572300 [Plakobranchus ocellatus]|uniref:Uncharacterized protein n=1 Tax=Plakobranchus ocellatus TaxID=259542 RepID=A0AAV4APC6_9GAST|nr:hypothetical protein PoB_003572300 [Plakobranchus ocellatus]
MSKAGISVVQGLCRKFKMAASHLNVNGQTGDHCAQIFDVTGHETILEMARSFPENKRSLAQTSNDSFSPSDVHWRENDGQGAPKREKNK